MNYEKLYKDLQIEKTKVDELLKSTTDLLGKANKEIDTRNKQIAELHKELSTITEKKEKKKEIKIPDYIKMFR